MAVKDNEVNVFLKMDVREFNKALKDAAAKIDHTYGSMEKVSKRAFQAMAAGATVAAAALLNLSKESVKVGANFEDAMYTLGSIRGVAVDALLPLEDTARDLGKQTLFTATQAAKGMQQLARAGLEVNEIISASGSALEFAGANFITMNMSTTLLAATMKQFSIAAVDATRITDTLTTAAQNSLFDIEGLATAMRYGGSAGSSLGASLEETVAMLAQFRNLGLESSMAGVRFRQSMLALSAPTYKAKKALAALNIPLDEVNPRIVGLEQAFLRLGKAGLTADKLVPIVNKISAADVAKISAQLYAASSATEAIGDASDKTVNDVERLMDKMRETRGVTKRTYDMIKASTVGQFKILQSAFQELQILIFDALKGGPTGTEKRFGALTDIIKATKQVVDDLATAFEHNMTLIGREITSVTGVMANTIDQNSEKIAASIVRNSMDLMAFGIKVLQIIPHLVTFGKVAAGLFLGFKINAATIGLIKFTQVLLGLIPVLRTTAMSLGAMATVLTGPAGIVAAVGAALGAWASYSFFSSDAREEAQSLSRILKLQKIVINENTAAINNYVNSIGGAEQAVAIETIRKELKERGKLTVELGRNLDNLRFISDEQRSQDPANYFNTSIKRGEELLNVSLDQITAQRLISAGVGETVSAYDELTNITGDLTNDAGNMNDEWEKQRTLLETTSQLEADRTAKTLAYNTALAEQAEKINRVREIQDELISGAREFEKIELPDKNIGYDVVHIEKRNALQRQEISLLEELKSIAPEVANEILNMEDAWTDGAIDDRDIEDLADVLNTKFGEALAQQQTKLKELSKNASEWEDALKRAINTSTDPLTDGIDELTEGAKDAKSELDALLDKLEKLRQKRIDIVIKIKQELDELISPELAGKHAAMARAKEFKSIQKEELKIRKQIGQGLSKRAEVYASGQEYMTTLARIYAEKRKKIVEDEYTKSYEALQDYTDDKVALLANAANREIEENNKSLKSNLESRLQANQEAKEQALKTIRELGSNTKALAEGMIGEVTSPIGKAFIAVGGDVSRLNEKQQEWLTKMAALSDVNIERAVEEQAIIKERIINTQQELDAVQKLKQAQSQKATGEKFDIGALGEETLEKQIEQDEERWAAIEANRILYASKMMKTEGALTEFTNKEQDIRLEHLDSVSSQSMSITTRYSLELAKIYNEETKAYKTMVSEKTTSEMSEVEKLNVWKKAEEDKLAAFLKTANDKGLEAHGEYLAAKFALDEAYSAQIKELNESVMEEMGMTTDDAFSDLTDSINTSEKALSKALGTAGVLGFLAAAGVGIAKVIKEVEVDIIKQRIAFTESMLKIEQDYARRLQVIEASYKAGEISKDDYDAQLDRAKTISDLETALAEKQKDRLISETMLFKGATASLKAYFDSTNVVYSKLIDITLSVATETGKALSSEGIFSKSFWKQAKQNLSNGILESLILIVSIPSKIGFKLKKGTKSIQDFVKTTKEGFRDLYLEAQRLNPQLEKSVNKVRKTLDGLKDEDFKGKLLGAVSILTGGIGVLFQGGIAAIKAGGAGLKGALGNLGSGLQGMLGKLGALTIKGFGTILKAVGTLAKAGFSKVIAAAQALGAVIMQVADTVNAGISFMTGGFSLNLLDMMTGGAEAITADAEKAQEALDKLNEDLNNGIITQEEYDEAIASGVGTPQPEIAAAQFVDDALDKALNFVDAIVTAAPIVVQRLIAKLPDLLNAIVAGIPVVLNALLGALPLLVIQLFNSITELVPLLVESIVTQLPNIVKALIFLITEKLPTLITELVTGISTIFDTIFAPISGENIEQLEEALKAGQISQEEFDKRSQSLFDTLVSAIVEGVTKLIEGLGTLIVKLVKAIPGIVQTLLAAIPELITSLLKGVNDIIKAILQALPDLVMFILHALPDIVFALLTGLLEMIEMLAGELPLLLAAIIEALPELVTHLIDMALQMVIAIVEAVPDILRAFIKALPVLIDALIGLIPELSVAIVKGIAPHLPDIVMVLIKELGIGLVILAMELSVAIVKGITDGLTGFFENIREWIDELKELRIFGGEGKNNDEGGDDSSSFLSDTWAEITSLGQAETETYNDTPGPILAGTNGLAARFAAGDYIIAAQRPLDVAAQALQLLGESTQSAIRGAVATGITPLVNTPEIQSERDTNADGIINIAVVAEGRVLDDIQVSAMERGHAPKMKRRIRKASGVTVGFSRGKYNSFG